MSQTGRYVVVDQKTGRRFVVEPISERDQKIDGQVFTNGGIGGDSVKNDQRGGSVREEDSVITPENGFGRIEYAKPGESPMDVIDRMLKEPK